MTETWLLILFQIIPWSGLEPVAILSAHNDYYSCARRQQATVKAIKEIEPAGKHIAFCMKE